MNLNEFKHIYFLGIGGIGMSALARYFKAKGFNVSGYDKTASKLTKQLQSEGINVHYEDKGTAILSELNVKESLVIYTPAIPKELGEYQAIVSTGFHLIKRAKALGIITQNSKGLGVAGTHGKTTTSTLLAHVLNQSSVGCNAFLGGIASNFESNLVLNETTDLTVIEADEFDQSFLELFPYASIITSTDADHLDIYKNAETLIESFQKYANKTANNGILIREINTQIKAENAITYATNQPELKADFHCQNIQFNNGKFMFDCSCNGKLWEKIELGIPGIHNASNATAVIALCLAIGLTEMEIRAGLKTFRGVKRRFEYHINKENLVYIDDYAHHPTEINALVSSTRLLYPKQKIVGIFQPHLYSRTNDFLTEFAQALSKLDEVILLPIYAARENPIDGVTSDALLQQIQCSNKQVLSKEATLEHIETTKNKAVYLTIGAGDIDALVEPLKALLL
ncbi:MAG: UDP-N-acetylmuramate--L-alanine ligase [Lishizhenia sp.]